MVQLASIKPSLSIRLFQTGRFAKEAKLCQNSKQYAMPKIVNLRFVFAATSANIDGTSNIVFFQISLDLKSFGKFEFLNFLKI